MKAVFLVFDNKFKKFFLKKYIALRTRGSFKENIVIITNREFSSLLVKFLCLIDKKVCVYKADFRYKNKQGETVVEDTKGIETPMFRLKKKLVEALYPDTEIIVVKKPKA